jgi:hypothetical protein
MDEAQFVNAVLRNHANRIILDRLPTLGFADAWLVSGAVFQSVWNVRTGRAPDYGIKDYDIFYFDRDVSWDAEDAIIRRLTAAFAELDVRIEPRNQARVHLWYSEKFGTAYPPLRQATDGIDRFLACAAQVGIRLVGKRYEVYAPQGFDDVAAMIVRPNRCPNFCADIYTAKAAGWQARWPELTILSAAHPRCA